MTVSAGSADSWAELGVCMSHYGTRPLIHNLHKYRAVYQLWEREGATSSLSE